MLVLTRKLNQQIQLGENIKITVLRVKGNTIRLGIEAPREVRVVRAELEPLPGQPARGEAVYRAEPEVGEQALRSPSPLGSFLPVALQQVG